MISRCWILVALSLACVRPAGGTPVVVDFAGGGSLPYTEDGLTVSALSGGNGAGVHGFGDGYLVAGTNFTPIRFHVAGEEPFDLLSLDVEQYYRTWTIESSSGAVFDVTGSGTLDFAGQPGWESISYFEIVHDPAEPNGSVRVDNVRVEFASSTIAGDYNGNAVIDAADYTVWRDNVGAATIPNRDEHRSVRWATPTTSSGSFSSLRRAAGTSRPECPSQRRSCSWRRWAFS